MVIMAVQRMLIMVKFFDEEKQVLLTNRDKFFDPRLSAFTPYNRTQNGNFLHKDDSDQVF